MTSIRETIREYDKSCRQVRTRIEQLNEELGLAAWKLSQESRKALESRRYLLYSELALMEEAMARMAAYLTATEKKGGARPSPVKRKKYR